MGASMGSSNSGSSSRKGRFLRRGGDQSQDFELNLAPVIDCLTVLIIFVLVSASYLSIGVLQTQVAAASSNPQQVDVPADKMLSIELKADHSIVVNLTDENGRASRVHRIEPLSGQKWDYNALIDHLAFVKSEWPKLQSAVLVADNDVAYSDVVKSMEIARKAVPSVLLGGY